MQQNDIINSTSSIQSSKLSNSQDHRQPLPEINDFELNNSQKIYSYQATIILIYLGICYINIMPPINMYWPSVIIFIIGLFLFVRLESKSKYHQTLINIILLLINLLILYFVWGSKINDEVAMFGALIGFSIFAPVIIVLLIVRNLLLKAKRQKIINTQSVNNKNQKLNFYKSLATSIIINSIICSTLFIFTHTILANWLYKYSYITIILLIISILTAIYFPIIIWLFKIFFNSSTIDRRAKNQIIFSEIIITLLISSALSSFPISLFISDINSMKSNIYAANNPIQKTAKNNEITLIKSGLVPGKEIINENYVVWEQKAENNKYDIAIYDIRQKKLLKIGTKQNVKFLLFEHSLLTMDHYGTNIANIYKLPSLAKQTIILPDYNQYSSDIAFDGKWITLVGNLKNKGKVWIIDVADKSTRILDISTFFSKNIPKPSMTGQNKLYLSDMDIITQTDLTSLDTKIIIAYNPPNENSYDDTTVINGSTNGNYLLKRLNSMNKYITVIVNGEKKSEMILGDNIYGSTTIFPIKLIDNFLYFSEVDDRGQVVKYQRINLNTKKIEQIKFNIKEKMSRLIDFNNSYALKSKASLISSESLTLIPLASILEK
ncbi:MAG: hypothetical protein CEN91_266 [Candidatus Berkelbacteria bacterium Licking1014_85]|uniref:Uncharacterized protein n=1 Tax=Candidatus Berkelbacteria bacterium Licking1014_85 TaxID=2017148 RepID=A0A554LK93_9BACT|nr:MAG: hypothetical protein CEN91_266 [Candidatus Berkelbacteria bacterium Licking1014_85]